jgi:hypothetical protein
MILCVRIACKKNNNPTGPIVSGFARGKESQARSRKVVGLFRFIADCAAHLPGCAAARSDMLPLPRTYPERVSWPFIPPVVAFTMLTARHEAPVLRRDSRSAGLADESQWPIVIRGFAGMARKH